MTTSELTSFIRNQAIELGFDACGFAKAEPLPNDLQASMRHWLENGFQAEMSYMENHLEKRMDPRLLVEGCRSLIVVAQNYYPSGSPKNTTPKIARFAYGQDYHFLLRNKLNKLLNHIKSQGISVSGRAFSDSAPLMERYWAWKAGLGWIGKNRHLILPGKGSYFFLGELVIDLELEYDAPMKNRCGTCCKCIKACPTKALNESCLNSNNCLSYLTIEKKGSFTRSEEKKVSNNEWAFGCDICQEACPWNRFARNTNQEELKPSKKFLALDLKDYINLTDRTFQELFSGTCLERTGLDGLLRNINTKQYK